MCQHPRQDNKSSSMEGAQVVTRQDDGQETARGSNVNDDDEETNNISDEEHTNNDNDNNDAEPQQEASKISLCCQKVTAFYWTNEFLILVVVVILLARAYPKLGAVYLAPDITATWLAVVFIFVMAGVTLKTEEFKKAFLNIYFNAFVQVFNFAVVSAVVYGVSRGLHAGDILSQDLADGMVICASLPMTINMVLVLTKAGGGDEAAAIFNASFGNLIGVFLSPLLILGYLGVTGDVNLLDVFYKLALRVIAPVAVGQLLRKTSPRVVNFVKNHKPAFKQMQQYCLVFIVYTVFCETFYDKESSSSIGNIFLMIAFQFLLLAGLMVLAWFALKVAFPNRPELRVMGLFGCTHKTVAMGIPLINAIYEGNPSIGLYTLPLLIWHPMQLVLGTFLTPRLAAFVEREKERLGITDDDDEEEKDEAEATEEGRISTREEEEEVDNRDDTQAVNQ